MAVFRATILLLAGLVLSMQASADERIEYPVHIERQSLPHALSMLASQINAPVFTVEERLSEIMVGPVVGMYSADAALQLLLADTGLTFIEYSRGYEIRRAPVIRAPAMPSAGRVVGDRALNAMMVVGKRIDAVPAEPTSVSLDAPLLDQFGASSVGEALAYIPQQPYALPESFCGDGAQYADLRGLGLDLTTVLINGRWVPPSATSGVAFDLNNVPLAAVEQVDAYPDPSTAPSGHRAIGGVIDVRLKRAGSSPKARIAYGAAAGGGAQRQVVLSAGAGSSRLTSNAVLEYFERDELPGKAREFWRDQNFTRFGGADYRSRASWPGNISSTTGTPLPGLSSSYAAVPLGTAGAQPEISDFQATAGTDRLDSLHRFSSILPATRRASVVASAEYSFQDDVTAFAELLGVRRFTEYQLTPPALTNALVPATNAFNPFGEPVYVSRLLSEMEPRRVVTNSNLLRVVAGVQGARGAWDWQVAALNSEESASRWANNLLDEMGVANALTSSDPERALNVFEEGPVGTPELMASLIAPTKAMDFRSIGSELSAALRGPVIMLPTGDVTAVLGAHWRRETTSSTRTVSSGHMELHVPLWGKQLAANLSTRFDHFSDIDPILNHHYALTWQPRRDLQVRWSHGRGFRVPSTYELFGPSYEVQTLVADRRRNGEISNITAHVGSSADLRSAHGESTAVSVRVMPPYRHDLEMSASYWMQRIDRRIVSAPLSLILDHEDAFADHIMRDQPTPDDLAAGRPGALRSVDLSLFNVGGIKASGVDATVSYRFNPVLRGQLSAAWMDEFAIFDVPGGAATNRIGVVNPRGTIPRWRATAAVHWNHEIASASLVARYVAPYNDRKEDQSTGRRLSSQTSIDVQASLALGMLAPTDALSRGVSLTVGMVNLLDRGPQYSAAGQDQGYDPSLSDPRQRFGYLRLEKQF